MVVEFIPVIAGAGILGLAYIVFTSWGVMNYVKPFTKDNQAGFRVNMGTSNIVLFFGKKPALSYIGVIRGEVKERVNNSGIKMLSYTLETENGARLFENVAEIEDFKPLHGSSPDSRELSGKGKIYVCRIDWTGKHCDWLFESVSDYSRITLARIKSNMIRDLMNNQRNVNELSGLRGSQSIYINPNESKEEGVKK
jgi:hypothetical protein